MADGKSENQPQTGNMARSLSLAIEERIQLIHLEVLKAVKSGSYSITFENKRVELDFYVHKMTAEKFPYVLTLSEEIKYDDASNKFMIAKVDKRIQTLLIRASKEF